MTARGDGAGRRRGVDTARRDAGLPGHAYAEGDIVKLKGSSVLWKVTQLLDTATGTGYMVVPMPEGAFKAVRDDKVKERIHTAAEWEAEQNERSNK